MGVTLLEAIFFLGISVVYLIMFGLSESISLQLNSLYRFFFMLILFVFLIYFLWHSVVKQTVMELFSFIALLTMLNVFFIYRESVVLSNNKRSDGSDLTQSEFIIGLVACLVGFIFTVFSISII